MTSLQMVLTGSNGQYGKLLSSVLDPGEHPAIFYLISLYYNFSHFRSGMIAYRELTQEGFDVHVFERDSKPGQQVPLICGTLSQPKQVVTGITPRKSRFLHPYPMQALRRETTYHLSRRVECLIHLLRSTQIMAPNFQNDKGSIGSRNLSGTL